MEKQELIEKYIQNRLSDAEKIKFDTLLASDIGFKKEVDLHVNLKKVTKHEDATNFKNLISEIEAAKSPKKRNYTKWLAAASIVLLLGLSYFLTLENKVSNNELFVAYFEPYRNVIQPIERGSSQQDQKTLAFTAYEKGDYKKAIDLFSKLYDNTNESYCLFYKANALLKLEKAKEAVPLLLEHLKTKDTLTEKSRWYLALAYLKLNNKVEAKKTLKKVISEKNYKMKEAKELLEKFE